DRSVVLGERTAGGSLFTLVIASKVGTDWRPSLSLVSRLEDALRGGVNHVRIVGRDQDRLRPPQAVFHIANAVAGSIHRPHRDVLLLVAVAIETRHHASARTCINDVRVLGIGLNVAALAAARVKPVLPPDITVVGPTGNSNRGAILLRAIHLIQ